VRPLLLGLAAATGDAAIAASKQLTARTPEILSDILWDIGTSLLRDRPHCHECCIKQLMSNVFLAMRLNFGNVAPQHPMRLPRSARSEITERHKSGQCKGILC
jgi:hypothetical protein